MTNDVNFDELARKSFAPEATTDDYERIFAALFSLPAWHFIAVGEFSAVKPYCALFPDHFGELPALAVFTDQERARRFMAEQETKAESAAPPVTIDAGDLQIKMSSENLILSVPGENVLDYIEQLLPQGIVKIFFNPDKNSHGFSHDLKMMRPIREHLDSNGKLTKPEENSAAEAKTDEPATAKTNNENNHAAPETMTETNGFDFDKLARAANESGGAMDDLNRLFGAAFALSEWLFVARGEAGNIYPYVASNQATADNQPMARAFTDAARLQRFAGENDLTRADGSCDILSIPTAGVIEYLEQFVEFGAYGVWFNSDTESDGFFIPIKQLRPIKDHLEKLDQAAPNAAAENENSIVTLLVKVKDGLMMPSGFIAQADYTCNFFCHVPENWLAGNDLKPDFLEKVYRKVYGDTWRSGNSDGSRYAVLESSTKIFTPAELQTVTWRGTEKTDENQFWFFVAEAGGELKTLQSDDFQAEIDAALQLAATENQRRYQDDLADYGMSQTPAGDFEQNLILNERGAISFDTPMAAFYDAAAPLLADYKGTGEFATLLAFDESGVSEKVENVIGNDHGDYLQIRRFLYLNPKNNVRIGVNSLHSNSLRHVYSNAEMIVSFELCKNLDNQTAAIYYRFEGPRSEVTLIKIAIESSLEKYGFEAVV